MVGQRFIIITVPPTPVADEVATLREHLCALAHSSAALAYPPHVTLRTGAIVPYEAIGDFLVEFGDLMRGWNSFEIRTDGLYCGRYTHDDGERFIVCYELVRDEALSLLNQRLLSYTRYRRSDRTDFNPHMTLVFDDLTQDNFRRLCQHLEEHPEISRRNYDWICDNVSLYVETGGEWRLFHVYPLIED